MTASPSGHAPARGSRSGRPAMEVLDEAVALLRYAPLAVHSIYYLGALPFCLGLIYFFFDMTQGADAEAHLADEALALTALYFWMKTCQAVFARRLLELLEGPEASPWPFSRWANTLLIQTIFAGSLIIVYPLALLITIPFGWVNAFYHNISIVGTETKSTVRSSFKEAAELAGLWPKQNHLILAILLIAVLVVFLNLAVFFALIPGLLNMLFGIESVFDEGTFAWNNSSFYLDVGVFCFLALNPLNKAVYALRCFYGRSRLSGADLKAELQRYSMTKSAALIARAVVVLAAFLLAAIPARADAPAPPPAASPVAVAPSDPGVGNLDRSIEKTLQKDEFTWRLPREQMAGSEDDTLFIRLMRSLETTMNGFMKKIGHEVGEFMKWLLDLDKKHDSSSGAFAMMQRIPWRLLLTLFAILVLGCLLYWLTTLLRRKKNATLTTLTPAAIRTVDLEAEDLSAADLPQDEWLALAQQLIERGELRLALRAFYLATLSVLAQNQLIRLASTKSNRDYLLELTRRLRGNVSAVDYFRDNVRLFEASWYGTHDVTTAVIETMRTNQQQVRLHAAA